MDDLVGEFVTETVESLGMLDQELVRLEQNPNDKAILSNIFRSVHTIKGASGFLGLPRLGSLAHAAENVLGMIRDGELDATPQAITLVLTSLDTIKGMVDYLGENGAEPEGSDAELIAELNRFAGGAPVVHAGPEYEIFSETEAVISAAPAEDLSSFFAGDDDLNALIEAEKKQKEAAQKPLAATPVAPKPVTKVEAPKEGAKDGAGVAQSIRVNIEVLESLMQMVGELVLSRNQLVQLVRTHAHTQQIFQSPIQQMSYIATALQEGIMKTRMQPISGAWAKFPRLVRDLSLRLVKKSNSRCLVKRPSSTASCLS